MQEDFRNCFLCRMMRGLALGGLGAGLFGVPARWLGASETEAIYFALFGALFVTTLFTRKKRDPDESDKG